MKIDKFELALEQSPAKRNFYLAGEEIKGNITIKVLEERVRIARLSLRVMGSARTAWQDKRTNIPYGSAELIMVEYNDLTSLLSAHCNEIMEIYGGEHIVQFSFKLPIDAVSSIEKEGYGSVRYCCVASLDVPDEGGDNEIVAETDFPVISCLNLDSPHFRDPVHAFEQLNVAGVCCHRPRGWIRADLCVSELGLLPGDMCMVTLTVENTVKKERKKKHRDEDHQCALISLCQQIDFRARAKLKPNTWERRSLTTAVQSHGTCTANCVKGPESRRLHFQIAEDLPPTSTKVNGLIAFTYFFRVEMDQQFDVIVPIVIGSQKSKSENGKEEEKTIGRILVDTTRSPTMAITDEITSSK